MILWTIKLIIFYGYIMKIRHKCIIFEGIDNSGKTTIINSIIQDFPDHFINILEPCKNKCDIGCFLRTKILTKDENELCDTSKMLLFTACRFQHIYECNNMSTNKIFLFDRSYLSMLVYNNLDDNAENIIKLNEMFFNRSFEILQVFIMKISPETSLLREKDIYSYEQLKKISNRYNRIFNNSIFNFNISIINAELDQHKVYEKVKNNIIKWIKK